MSLTTFCVYDSICNIELKNINPTDRYAQARNNHLSRANSRISNASVISENEQLGSVLSEKKKRVFKSTLANLSKSRERSKDSENNSPIEFKKITNLFENRGNEYCLTMMDPSSPLRNPRLR